MEGWETLSYNQGKRLSAFTGLIQYFFQNCSLSNSCKEGMKVISQHESNAVTKTKWAPLREDNVLYVCFATQFRPLMAVFRVKMIKCIPSVGPTHGCKIPGIVKVGNFPWKPMEITGIWKLWKFIIYYINPSEGCFFTEWCKLLPDFTKIHLKYITAARQSLGKH